MSYEPTVMRKALARLERRRDGRERRRWELEQELYKRQPRLRQIDAELRGTMADLALLAAGGRPIRADGPEIAAIRARSEGLQAERAKLLAELGYGPDALDGVPACPRCGDRGWADGEMCTCLRELCAQEQIRALTALLNLTDEQDFDRLRLDVYSGQPWNGARSPRENMSRVAAVCEGYARQFPNYPLKNLLLSGGTGLGKTFLSGCIAREVSQRGFSVVYDTAGSVFDAFYSARRYSRDAEQERQARDDTRRYLSCDLMILDDLGSEQQNLPSVKASLYELVNGRIQARRHTIISSNLSTEDMGEQYGPQLASRIRGLYRELTFYGEDLRVKLR